MTVAQANETIEGWLVSRNSALATIARADPNRRMTANDARAFGHALNSFARDADLYAMTFATDVLVLDDDDMTDDASAALAELVWRLDCFSKPIVSLIDGPVGEIGLAFALAGTHRVATRRAHWTLSSPGRGRLPSGNIVRSLAEDVVRSDEILGGAPVGAAEALSLGWATHIVDEVHIDEIRHGLAAADPVDPLCDDRRVVLDFEARAGSGERRTSLAPAVQHAVAEVRPLELLQALADAARFDAALRRFGANATPASIDRAIQNIDVTLPERRVLQAFRRQ